MAHSNKKIAIFCGSSFPKDKKFVEEIEAFVNQLFMKNDFGLVYGGAKIGIMGIVANAALKYSREVIGVMPTFLREREVHHETLDQFIECETMHERKEKMYEMADAFLILPGGFGTLDEFFEILTWKQLNQHQKPIYILNVQNFFRHMVSQIEVLKDVGFIKGLDEKLFTLVDKNDEIHV